MADAARLPGSQADTGNVHFFRPRDGIYVSEGAEERGIAVAAHLPPAMARSTWRVDDFELHKELYRGKTSLLYSATDRGSGIPVALKLYRKRKLSILNRYQVEREIRIHIAQNHDNIIKLFAAFEDEKHVYMVQEYASCGDLFEDLKKGGGQVKEKQAVQDIIVPFLSALVHLHAQGIVHRDIKPENILLGAGKVIKVADFGLSININHERPVTRAGTLDYMAPEVLICPDKRAPDENKDKVLLGYTAQVDAWAVGILAYELLVGYPPFEQESRAATYEHIMYKDPKFPSWMSEDAKKFIACALCKNSTQRTTVQDLVRNPWLWAHAPRASDQHMPVVEPASGSRASKPYSQPVATSQHASSQHTTQHAAGIQQQQQQQQHGEPAAAGLQQSSLVQQPAQAHASARIIAPTPLTGVHATVIAPKHGSKPSSPAPTSRSNQQPAYLKPAPGSGSHNPHKDTGTMIAGADMAGGGGRMHDSISDTTLQSFDPTPLTHGPAPVLRMHSVQGAQAHTSIPNSPTSHHSTPQQGLQRPSPLQIPSASRSPSARSNLSPSSVVQAINGVEVCELLASSDVSMPSPSGNSVSDMPVSPSSRFHHSPSAAVVHMPGALSRQLSSPLFPTGVGGVTNGSSTLHAHTQQGQPRPRMHAAAASAGAANASFRSSPRTDSASPGAAALVAGVQAGGNNSTHGGHFHRPQSGVLSDDTMLSMAGRMLPTTGVIALSPLQHAALSSVPGRPGSSVRASPTLLSRRNSMSLCAPAANGSGSVASQQHQQQQPPGIASGLLLSLQTPFSGDQMANFLISTNNDVYMGSFDEEALAGTEANHSGSGYASAPLSPSLSLTALSSVGSPSHSRPAGPGAHGAAASASNSANSSRYGKLVSKVWGNKEGSPGPSVGGAHGDLSSPPSFTGKSSNAQSYARNKSMSSRQLHDDLRLLMRESSMASSRGPLARDDAGHQSFTTYSRPGGKAQSAASRAAAAANASHGSSYSAPVADDMLPPSHLPSGFNTLQLQQQGVIHMQSNSPSPPATAAKKSLINKNLAVAEEVGLQMQGLQRANSAHDLGSSGQNSLIARLGVHAPPRHDLVSRQGSFSTSSVAPKKLSHSPLVTKVTQYMLSARSSGRGPSAGGGPLTAD